MDGSDVVDRVRELRSRGVTPKAIARAVGLPPSQVTPILRALATADEVDVAQRPVVGCWVSPGWANGLGVDPRPEWSDASDADPHVGGLVSVVVAREERRGRVGVCGYLVDVYCLGVKNVVGPRVMDPHAVRGFIADFFGAYDQPPVTAPLDLAQHLVFGAVEYARGLGFDPHPDFAAAAAHLGTPEGPRAITFGHDGKPLYIQGPHDDPQAVLRTLDGSVGKNNYHFLVMANEPRRWVRP